MQENSGSAIAAGVRQSGAVASGRSGFALKAIVIAVLMLVLLIPLGMINGTINERKNYRLQAVKAVAESFAGAQTLAGPVLVVPYTDSVMVLDKDSSGKTVSRLERSSHRWIVFPTTLSLQGRLLPSVRKLGLHEVRVYELQSTLKAHFEKELPADPVNNRVLGTPYLSFAIADVRGLVGTPVLQRERVPLRLEQGPGGERGGSGLHAKLAQMRLGERLRFDIELRSNLAGTESLAIAPIADSNHIALDSSWPHPQFAGRFLPRSRRIQADGFQAQWDISSLAAGTQGQYLSAAALADLDGIRLGLVEPVNIYTQADRASKYGILFVLLTFVGFFLFEMLRQLPIHPVQYGLVGLALAIFFLLLLSLSEHLEFQVAYLIASAACIGLLGVYLSAVLKSRLRALAFVAVLGLLYAALYGLLVSEDNALVLGSMMLFAILAALMLATRGINWYQPGPVLAGDGPGAS